MYISDNHHTVCLNGLRWITKKDQTWSNKTEYQLEIAYKGQLHTLRYDGLKDRDKFYDQVKKALEVRRVNKL